MAQRDELLWTERYRPKRVEECILPAKMLATFHQYVEQGHFPNMILAGTAGVGKTTIARALCEEMGCDYIVINGSKDSGIDTLRTTIQSFCSTVSMFGSENAKVKVVIIDEADYLNPQSTQPALRAFMEQYTNCRFIFTCNYKNRIIPPLHSRAPVMEFKLAKEDRPRMAGKFMTRLKEILKLEGVEFEEKVVAQLLTKHFPDYRRVLGELQRYSAAGQIDAGILIGAGDVDTKPLLETLRAKDWTKMRSWVTDNLDNDSSVIYRKFFDTLLPEAKEPPQLVIVLHDYSYKAAFVTDQELNLVACLTEVMATCTFK
jgi:DNA polymerase III delta prime subunit